MSVQERYSVQIHTAAVAANTDEIFPFIIPRAGVWKLESAVLVAGTAITAHASNYTDLSIEIGGTEVASELSTAGDLGTIAANGIAIIALVGTGTDLEVTGGTAGTVVEILKTDAGTGVAVDGTFCLDFVKIRA